MERSGKSLIGSAASGEGLVNVYRGTGKVLMMPTAKMPNIRREGTGTQVSTSLAQYSTVRRQTADAGEAALSRVLYPINMDFTVSRQELWLAS